MKPELQAAARCLERAQEIVTQERNQSHGGVLETHRLIGNLWGDYLNIPISALDVTQLMELLKIARARMGDRLDLDHYVDQAGYAGCAAAIIEAERRETQYIKVEDMPSQTELPFVGTPIGVEDINLPADRVAVQAERPPRPRS